MFRKPKQPDTTLDLTLENGKVDEFIGNVLDRHDEHLNHEVAQVVAYVGNAVIYQSLQPVPDDLAAVLADLKEQQRWDNYQPNPVANLPGSLGHR